ncbi:MAG: LysM peptidoglycan-binding domain-containing protein [Candidatus Sericytochromatia bacterium]|nr:LysM peptidoglycan-binding domain-containing protein [Candidatus Sericytochromatia bacterium]
MPRLNPQSSPASPWPGIRSTAADPLRTAATPTQRPASSSIPSRDLLQVNPQGRATASLNLNTEPEFLLHTVKRGETLGQIAQQYLGDTNRHPEIFAANADELRNPNDIRMGMVLKIPNPEASRPEASRPAQPPRTRPAARPEGATSAPAAEPRYTQHTVKRGETLGMLALRHLGDSERYMEIYEANRDQMRSPNALRPGMTLKIPSRTTATSGSRPRQSRPQQSTPVRNAAPAADTRGLTPRAQELLHALHNYQDVHRAQGNAHRAETSAAELREIAIEMDRAATAFDMDPKMMLAVFAHESGGFDPRARSQTGAGGLGQLTGVAIRQVHHMAGIGKGNTGRAPFTQYKSNFVQNHRAINERFDIKKNIWTATAYMSYELNDRARLGRGVENALKRYGDPSIRDYAQKVNNEHRTLFGSRLF